VLHLKSLVSFVTSAMLVVYVGEEGDAVMKSIEDAVGKV
jgi:hypothetical protein